MSKDWTPKQMYIVDKQYKDSGVEGLRDLDFTIVYNGEEFPLMGKQVRERISKYSELGFLFDNLNSIYSKYSENLNEVDTVLSDVEQSLRAVEEDKTYDSKYVDFDIVKKWFNGELDGGFYYNTYNNELFEEEICKQIESLIPSNNEMTEDSVKKKKSSEHIKNESYDATRDKFVCSENDVKNGFYNEYDKCTCSIYNNNVVVNYENLFLTFDVGDKYEVAEVDCDYYIDIDEFCYFFIDELIDNEDEAKMKSEIPHSIDFSVQTENEHKWVIDNLDYILKKYNNRIGAFLASEAIEEQEDLLDINDIADYCSDVDKKINYTEEDFYEELNPLKDAQKKAKKKSKGLSRFCTMKKDAGNVEAGIKFFNNAMGSSDSGSGESVGTGVAEAVQKPVYAVKSVYRDEHATRMETKFVRASSEEEAIQKVKDELEKEYTDRAMQRVRDGEYTARRATNTDSVGIRVKGIIESDNIEGLEKYKEEVNENVNSMSNLDAFVELKNIK